MDEQQSVNQSVNNQPQSIQQAQASQNESVKPVLTQYQTVVSPNTPKWTVILLLLTFPPIAWYLMWREKKYHSWFSILMMVYAIITILVLVMMSLFVIPQMTKLNATLKIQNPLDSYVYPLVAGGIIFSILQILCSLYIRKPVKMHGELSKKMLVITIMIILLNNLFTGVIIAVINLSIIAPVYSLYNTY